MPAYSYQPETVTEMAKVSPACVSGASMRLGAENAEPLLVCLDSMLRYARAYKARFGDPVGEDGFLGDEVGKVLAGLRALLNGDGAVAMERDRTTDSKDNGVCEALYWHCCAAAGLDGETL